MNRKVQNEWKRTHKTTKDDWEYNIKTDLIELGCEVLEEHNWVQNTVHFRGVTKMGQAS
jgi:hypothetical protein